MKIQKKINKKEKIIFNIKYYYYIKLRNIRIIFNLFYRFSNLKNYLINI